MIEKNITKQNRKKKKIKNVQFDFINDPMEWLVLWLSRTKQVGEGAATVPACLPLVFFFLILSTLAAEII